jgi:hypothetical protein
MESHRDQSKPPESKQGSKDTLNCILLTEVASCAVHHDALADAESLFLIYIKNFATLNAI